MLKRKRTRFRAYKLGSAGSSFSYFDGNNFTLIESRYNDVNMDSIREEMAICGVTKIDNLHITSWDKDHCSTSDLERILDDLKPTYIECPGYEPHTEIGTVSLNMLNKKKKSGCVAVKRVTPDFISSLNKAKSYGYNDILYHPKKIIEDEKSANDNSTIKLFRSGCFNVLSLGDVECPSIASALLRKPSIKNEVDIMILAHHGADNGFTSNKFVRLVKPKITIASTNRDNMYGHPKPAVRSLLSRHNIKCLTTKNGDVVVESTSGHDGVFSVSQFDAKGNRNHVSVFKSKKMKYLSCNSDSLLNKLNKTRRRPFLK